jgi:hypothetical protein
MLNEPFPPLYPKLGWGQRYPEPPAPTRRPEPEHTMDNGICSQAPYRLSPEQVELAKAAVEPLDALMRSLFADPDFEGPSLIDARGFWRAIRRAAGNPVRSGTEGG